MFRNVGPSLRNNCHGYICSSLPSSSHFILGNRMSWLRVHPWLETQLVLTPRSIIFTCPKLVPFCKPQCPHLQNRDASIYLTGLLRVRNKTENICKVEHSTWVMVSDQIDVSRVICQIPSVVSSGLWDWESRGNRRLPHFTLYPSILF